jgi:hypothetical protein
MPFHSTAGSGPETSNNDYSVCAPLATGCLRDKVRGVDWRRSQ